MIINLKEAVLDYKPGQMDPWSQKNRLHALEVLNYIELIEKQEIVPEIAENNIEMRDFAVLLNFEYKINTQNEKVEV